MKPGVKTSNRKGNLSACNGQTHPDSPRPQKFKAQQSAEKAMLTAFRDPYYRSLRSQTSPSMPNGTPKHLLS
ncbi:hypothetical protein TNCT_545371 [Trichonephila clavata]|uniref:Uncharacterized protein n=1 Tax=Trichonephila clavata TaxID=2740835 RepID=A0A8X6LET4_TRICU|nr:hypothetical protein TNCT_545371 [Trichonephila clavata]